MMTMNRENGFYWVKMCGKWEIARWQNAAWFLTGTNGLVYDGMCDEIDERRITREEPTE